MKTIAFFYTMKNEPDFIKSLVPGHIKYWKDLDLPDYKGGPFSDHSGGLITFSSDDFESANEIIHKDPFVESKAISEKQVKTWIVETD